MRELSSIEITGVSGAGMTFTTPVNASTLNDLSKFGGVTKYATAAFSVGYAIGTWLNERYNISGRIVDALD